MFTTAMLGAPRRGGGRRGGRRRTVTRIIERGAPATAFISTDPYVDLTPRFPPPAPPPIFTVERAGQVVGRFPDVIPAVQLAKSVSKDGTEVTIKAGGHLLAGFKNGRRSMTVLEGLGDRQDAARREALERAARIRAKAMASDIAKIVEETLVKYGVTPTQSTVATVLKGALGDGLGRTKRAGIDRDPRIVGGERPGLTAHQKAVIDELSQIVRERLIASGIIKPDPVMKGLGYYGWRPMSVDNRLTTQGVGLGDTLTVNLPRGAIETVQRYAPQARTLLAQLAPLARGLITQITQDPALRTVATQTAARARQLLATQGSIITRRV